MAEQKIFAGPRVRRIRNQQGLTQTAMAAALGISPSYLNLIERNQRPLTVQLLLKLASVYKIDLEDLQSGGDSVLPHLKEMFADPLLAAELPGDQELVEVSDVAPNVATAMLKLYRAYREGQERLTDLSDLLAREGHETKLSGARLPMDEAREAFERRANHFVSIEEEAASFIKLLSPGDDLLSALRDWLRADHGIAVKVMPVATMPQWRRRYDRHSNRLFISERLSSHDQLREVAIEAALLRMRVAIDAEVADLKLSSDEARRIGRFELARYAAHALMMPYEPYLAACERSQYDIDVLRSRFGVSFEQAANRLTMMQRPGASGVPFFMLEVDHAGNRFRRAGATGFPQARFGGGCPKLPVHSVFSQPGHIAVEAVEMPDGTSFLVIARTLEGPQGAFHERPRRTALLLGCELTHRDRVIYGAALAGPHDNPLVTPVGPACRVCERAGCLARAEPPITKPLGLDEMVAGLSAFDFG
ncbi:helix-turn-helix domain-containing protein [Oricola sp.]|uniref:helix-turn-helix domain-containing protein n=1 Tax=Oricola sp. TaxID=1979950 RepID=UPI003BA9B671